MGKRFVRSPSNGAYWTPEEHLVLRQQMSEEFFARFPDLLQFAMKYPHMFIRPDILVAKRVVYPHYYNLGPDDDILELCILGLTEALVFLQKEIRVRQAIPCIYEPFIPEVISDGQTMTTQLHFTARYDFIEI